MFLVFLEMMFNGKPKVAEFRREVGGSTKADRVKTIVRDRFF